jgi:hypothetical protein
MGTTIGLREEGARICENWLGNWGEKKKKKKRKKVKKKKKMVLICASRISENA